MPIDMDLAKKGTRCSRAALLNQSLYHLELQARYGASLGGAGWTAANAAELVDQYEYLKTRIHETADARAGSQTHTQNEHRAVDDAKAFKRKLTYGFADLHAEGRVLDADYKLVRESGSLLRSTPKIIAYFTKIRGQVSKYDADLAPYFGGTSALSIFDSVLSQLEHAQGTQELNLAALPQETLKLYEAMGRVLTLIEKMNRIGRIAFDGQARIVAEFNKDLLLQAQKPRRTQSAVEPTADKPCAGTEEEKTG